MTDLARYQTKRARRLLRAASLDHPENYVCPIGEAEAVAMTRGQIMARGAIHGMSVEAYDSQTFHVRWKRITIAAYRRSIDLALIQMLDESLRIEWRLGAKTGLKGGKP